MRVVSKIQREWSKLFFSDKVDKKLFSKCCELQNNIKALGTFHFPFICRFLNKIIESQFQIQIPDFSHF